MHVAVKSTMLFMMPSPIAPVYGSAVTAAFWASLVLFFYYSCSEVETRNFFLPLDNNGSYNSAITDCTDAQASPSLGSPVQASSPSCKILNKRTGNIARKTSTIQDTLTAEWAQLVCDSPDNLQDETEYLNNTFTTGRPPSVSDCRCWLKSEQRSFVIYRRNIYEQYGGYNLFQNAELKANFSINVWRKC